VLSADAVTRREPSGLNATLRTLLVCPRHGAICAPVVASQTYTRPSSSAEATRLPSGLKATAQISFLWATPIAVCRPEDVSYSARPPSRACPVDPGTAKRKPSGLRSQTYRSVRRNRGAAASSHSRGPLSLSHSNNRRPPLACRTFAIGASLALN